MSVNRVILVGNLGKDVETYIPAGSDRISCRFTLATTEKRRSQTGELEEETQWHNVNYWARNDSALPSYLKKGAMVLVEGAIKYREYTTQQGEKKSVTEIVATRIELVGGKSQSVVTSQRNNYQPNGIPGGYQPQTFQQPHQQAYQQAGTSNNVASGQQPLYQQAQQMPSSPAPAPRSDDDLPF